jgi:hypothetical protein
MESGLLDVAGHRRSPATTPGYPRPLGGTRAGGRRLARFSRAGVGESGGSPTPSEASC